MDEKFVKLNAFEGLLSQGLRPINIRVNKLNRGGYALQAVVVNTNQIFIEDAEIVKVDYRLKALARNCYKR